MTSFVPVCTSMPVRVLLYLNSFPEDTWGALAGAGAELWERLPGNIDENCLGLGVAFAFAFGVASYAPTSSTLCCAFQSCQAWLSAIGRLVPGSRSRTSCGVTLPPLLLLLPPPFTACRASRRARARMASRFSFLKSALPMAICVITDSSVDRTWLFSTPSFLMNFSLSLTTSTDTELIAGVSMTVPQLHLAPLLLPSWAICERTTAVTSDSSSPSPPASLAAPRPRLLSRPEELLLLPPPAPSGPSPLPLGSNNSSSMSLSGATSPGGRSVKHSFPSKPPQRTCRPAR
mmetsp:Transcript_7357/g.26858  ORF Transcript_7357/g.26858 Transcript_7357/m.26858 type:complete len:289 (-) Transcript_7357:412-1278(-)